MSMLATNSSELKSALKEALVELFQERRDLFHDLFREVIEEAGLAEKIIPAIASTPNSPNKNEFEQEVAKEINAFHRLHPTLLEEHLGEYVAIYRQQLVDHDPKKLALYARIQEQYPEQFVLMRRVENEPERELHFRSTRFFIKRS